MASAVGVPAQTNDLHAEGTCLLVEEALRLARLLPHQADGMEALDRSCQREGMQAR
jgi:hypothetical protein